MRILNIIFDLGGVVIDLDVKRTYEGFRRLFGEDVMNLEHGYLRSSLQTDYEIGAIDSEEFLDGLEALALEGVTRQDIIDAWNAMLIGIPKERALTLESLSDKYRIFILSNTNSIHEECFERMLPGHEKLSDIFEKAYYSHRIGCRKPDPEAFKVVLEGSGLKPGETLFVDDLELNIEAAKKLNLHTLHVMQNMEIADIFKDW